MSEKPTGVFVRLPLSDEQRAKIVAEMMFAPISVSGAFAKAALRIGTPVTGGELDVIGYADSKEIDSFTPSADINPCAVIFAEEITSHSIPLVRQSDAQARIAALEAEIVRKDRRIAELEGELSGFRAGLSELIAKEVAALKGGAA
ncbi:MAG: hypothetical protein ABF979_15905 [Gluconobacter sp.]|uniref:hypothetical protein n=1 Tax=Gluconobacter sp. TaxID=1876758 RepID=UPI0039E8DF58